MCHNLFLLDVQIFTGMHMKLLKEMNQRTKAEKNGRILSVDNKWHSLWNITFCSKIIFTTIYSGVRRKFSWGVSFIGI